MKFLIGNALSPLVSRLLGELGHDSVRVRDRGCQAASDSEIFDLALLEERVIISADTDFSQLLAQRQTSKPSVILFRKGAERSPLRQVDLLSVNLTHEVITELEQGCILTFEGNRIRIRHLPLFKSER